MASSSKNVIWEMHRMILPDVVREIAKERRKKQQVEKPVLAEDKLQEMEHSITESMALGRPVKLTFYQGGIIKSIIGLPQRVKGRQLLVWHSSGQVSIPMKDVLDVN